MKVYGVEFEITNESIDQSRVDVVPGEGAILPLVLETIDGFYQYLIRNRCIRNNKIDMIYIFSAAVGGEQLCVKYLDGNVSVIQDVGNIIFCRGYIA